MLENKKERNSCSCKQCGKSLFESKDNKIKIRTNIVVFEKSNENDFEHSVAVIKCPNCKTDNQVPLLLDTQNNDLKLLVLDN